MSKAALRHLVRELQSYFPINSGLRAAQIVNSGVSNRWERESINPPIKLLDGSEALPTSERRHGGTAYLFDPTPDAAFPHPVYYTVGYYHTLEIGRAQSLPTDLYELIPFEKEVVKTKLLLEREPAVHGLLVRAMPHVVKVDVYDLATRAGLSTTTIRSWVERGHATHDTRERLAAVLGVEPDEIP